MAQYTTGELAKECGITVRTVQFYDQRGILVPSALTEGGRRLYSEEDLKKLGTAPDESREMIMDVMNLPEKYREVVLLVFLQGMTLREAADCMQTSASTISRRLEKAKRMIA